MSTNINVTYILPIKLNAKFTCIIISLNEQFQADLSVIAEVKYPHYNKVSSPLL